LWNAIEAGQFPSWELGVQIMDESQQLAFGFDLFDPTKIVPEEIVPVTPLGKMTLNLNPTNYFAETEQVMFQPGHIVRGIDFTEDPLLQGRLFSYLDTQLNRNGGPNFEQLPVNRPRVPVHNNNRDGFSQQFIPSNVAPYFPNTLNNNSPFQANQTVNNGFFTAPGRTISGPLLRTVSPTFADVWSQPRLFFNSLIPVEQQFLINAMRFETSHIQSPTVKQNVIVQLNRISNDLARRVALALGLSVPAPDPTFYNQNTTAFVSILNNTLPTIVGLNVGILTTTSSNSSLSQALALSQAFTALGVNPTIVGEHLGAGITQTYSAADATGFDGIIVTAGTESLFLNSSSTLFPAGRPQQILVSGFRWGKPVGALGSAATAFQVSGISATPGVYLNATTVPQMVSDFQNGLKQFKFLDRFPVDNF
jgi:catalase